MSQFFRKLKIRLILITTACLIGMILWSYFIPDTVMTRITDAQMAKVDGRFMIATEDRPMVNEDAKYRFKFDAGTIQNDAIRLRGKVVRIRKYGWRFPLFSMFENVVEIEEVQEHRGP